MEFSKRIASAGRIAGLTEAQVLSTAGAFASAGIEAEAGGTAVSKVLASMTEAAATGNKNLRMFAAVSGMTATEFATAWREDAGLAFSQFVQGLGQAGDQAYGILRSLGLNDERLKRAFLSIAGAQTTLTSVMEMGTRAWEENVALVNEANERYKTARSRLIMIGNRARNAAISFGGALAPMLEATMNQAEKLIGVLQRLGESFANLPAPIRTTIGTLMLFLAAVGPAYLIMAGLNKIIGITMGLMVSLQGFAANTAFAFAAWRGGAATLGQSLVYLVGGPVKAVILGMGAIAVAGVLLMANWDKVKSYTIATWNTIAAAVMYGASLVVRGIGLIITALGLIIPSVKAVGQHLIGLADNLKNTAGQALISAKTIAGSANTAAKAAEAQKAIANAGQAAANTQAELADSIEGVGKAAQANLQSFDEIHQIQDSLGSETPSLDEFSIPAMTMPEISGIGGGIGDLAAGMGEQISQAAEKAASSWDRLKQSMEPVNKAVQWIKSNWPTIGPIVEGIASIIMIVLVPALVKSGVEATIAATKHVAAWVVSGLEAVKQGAIMIGQLLAIVAKWALLGIQAIIHAAEVVAAWAMQGWAAVAQGAVMIAQFVLIIAKWAWASVQAMIQAARMAAAWVVALGPIAWVTAAVVALAVLIIANWDWIKDKTIEIWGSTATWLSDKWDSLKSLATGTWERIKASIVSSIQASRDWIYNGWNEIDGFLNNIWEGIKSTAKNTWEGITGVIKTAINGIIGLMNKLITGWNKLKFSVPSVDMGPLGSFGGYTIQVPQIKEIPMLAKGTNFVPDDMFAYLHKGEAVVPKEFNPSVANSTAGSSTEDIAQAVYKAILDAFRVSQTGQSQSDREVVLRIDSTAFARLILPSIIKEGQRQGLNLVVRPRGV